MDVEGPTVVNLEGDWSRSAIKHQTPSTNNQIMTKIFRDSKSFGD
jgi:hypothetical protein